MAILGLVTAAFGVAARADIVPPINLQIKEADEGSVQVQWKVPSQLPANATPVPVLPNQCVTQGDREIIELPAAGRLLTESFDCERSLGGEEVGIEFPFYNTTFSTLARVELRSGEQFVHVLEPGNERWTLPLGTTGLRQDPWTNFKLAVVGGVDHFFSNWFHPGFLLVICLIAGRREAIGLATAFSAGQLAALLIGFWSGLSLNAALAEVGPLLATVLLAAQSLKSSDELARGTILVGAAGALHGLGLGAMASIPISFAEVEWLFQALMIVGMDAVLIASCALLSPLLLLLTKTPSGRLATRALKYALGGVGFATALGLVVLHPVTEIEAQEKNASLPGLSMGSGSTASLGSRALAPRGTGAPVQLFVTIAPFETRLETLVSLDDVVDRLDLRPQGALPIENQEGAKATILDMVQQSVTLAIDGTVQEPEVDRVDFLEVGTKGVLPRTEAIPEQVSRAHLGVTLSYLSETIPDEVRVEWSDPGYDWTSIPLTVTDPESTRSLQLTEEEPTFTWTNELMEDPIPKVETLAVQPKSYTLPLFALPLFALALLLLVKVVRRKRPRMSFAWARVSIAAALLVAPNGRLSFEVEASAVSVPSRAEARSILLALLPNIYRAFEFREESAVYDRLALNVTGDTLSDIYLEHRRALQMEERGGAQARVEAVEVPEVRLVEARGDGGFDIEATWLVGGTVTHFGHRHFRQNRYDALVSLMPIEGVWKIDSIEILAEERLK